MLIDVSFLRNNKKGESVEEAKTEDVFGWPDCFYWLATKREDYKGKGLSKLGLSSNRLNYKSLIALVNCLRRTRI